VIPTPATSPIPSVTVYPPSARSALDVWPLPAAEAAGPLPWDGDLFGESTVTEEWMDTSGGADATN